MTTEEKIKKLKKERKAVILVHNYQLPEIHDIADYVGDSLGLSMQAAKTDAEVIVFCGVHFMAETAKILSPDKTVIIPDAGAGCPMADMINADQLRELKAKHPGARVLCYVNTTAEVKAECDLCCTSANALQMVGKALKDAPEIIFVPDQNLASYVEAKTGKEMIKWPGYCPIHADIRQEHIARQRELHPGAKVIVHPECTKEVIEAADVVTSTEGMCRHVRDSGDTEFIIATEVGIIYRLQKENPGKLFYPASGQSICENMKKVTLDKLLHALENMQEEVVVERAIADRARTCIQRMLDFSR